MNDQKRNVNSEQRVFSVDLFRGVVMFLLIAEAAGLYELLIAPAFNGTVIRAIGQQFQHSPWNGLRLWDLGQPFFMFISGTAMFFSCTKRWEKGERWRDTFFHALKRSFILFSLGWAIYLIVPVDDNSRVAFLYDMLPQLAVAGLVAFLILKRSIRAQLVISFGLIALTELSYRLWAAIGGGPPFLAGRNFGTAVDRLVLGSISADNWVIFNAVPLTAFMIWGAVVGRWLRGEERKTRNVTNAAFFGLGGVAAGLALSPVTPIIRRISTSSFVILGGGACLLAFALSHWLMDVVRIRRGSQVFLAVGMNPLFIYLFAQTGGAEWLRQIAVPFTAGLAGWAGEWPAAFVTALAVQALMCLLCYALYRRKIFMRI